MFALFVYLWCLCSALVVVRTEVFYGIVHVAKLSFLAGTRNLMIMPVGCVFDLSPALCCR